MTEAITVVITADTIVISSPYGARELIKQIPGRKWDPDRKVWTVPEIFESAARTVLDSWMGGVVYDDRRKQPSRARAPTDWADGMFQVLPTSLQLPAYRALSRVLHPDTGGDNKAMQQLNAAYERNRTAAS